jgi:hypothetical protein
LLDPKTLSQTLKPRFISFDIVVHLLGKIGLLSHLNGSQLLIVAVSYACRHGRPRGVKPDMNMIVMPTNVLHDGTPVVAEQCFQVGRVSAGAESIVMQ